MIVVISIEGAKHQLSDYDEFEISDILCSKLGIEDGDIEAEFEYYDE